ncbi:MAG: hypothetical protein KF884_09805 [Fimbriimonadaceae bacterium]|nr:hypothetical protein [Fimbriimonadaceae bacterium]QYK57841.1 MAG: hypothetical protein KF884_09805 [Fimbriimonadaceae bacterium]
MLVPILISILYQLHDVQFPARLDPSECRGGHACQSRFPVVPKGVRQSKAEPIDPRYIIDNSEFTELHRRQVAPAKALAKTGRKVEALGELVRLRAEKHPLADDLTSGTILRLMLDLGLESEALKEVEGRWKISSTHLAIYLFLTGKERRVDQEAYTEGSRLALEILGRGGDGWRTSTWPPNEQGWKESVVLGAFLQSQVGSPFIALRFLRDADAIYPDEPVIVLPLVLREFAEGNYDRVVRLCDGAIPRSTGNWQMSLKSMREHAAYLRNLKK